MPSTTTTTCSPLISRFLCSRLAQAVRFVSRRRRGCASWRGLHGGGSAQSFCIRLSPLHDSRHRVFGPLPSNRMKRYLILIEAAANRWAKKCGCVRTVARYAPYPWPSVADALSWRSNGTTLALDRFLRKPRTERKEQHALRRNHESGRTMDPP